MVYIGETGRSETRLVEHQRCLRSSIFSKSSEAEHQLQIGHRILFDIRSVVAKSSYYVERKIREVVEIVKNRLKIGTLVIHCLQFGISYQGQLTLVISRVDSLQKKIN